MKCKQNVLATCLKWGYGIWKWCYNLITMRLQIWGWMSKYSGKCSGKKEGIWNIPKIGELINLLELSISGLPVLWDKFLTCLNLFLLVFLSLAAKHISGTLLMHVHVHTHTHTHSHIRIHNFFYLIPKLVNWLNFYWYITCCQLWRHNPNQVKYLILIPRFFRNCSNFCKSMTFIVQS